MAQFGGEDVYATLLLTDSYLPGALVLAHSLRDAGTTKKLAALVTLDSVSAEVVTQLKAVFDYVIPVNRVRNESPANLDLMNRRDLHSAFTKINLWKQTQFRKIVYIDADVVAYRAPDELFDLPHAFCAAPDIGWPDLFNTGVMVLTPDMGEYYALMAMAERGVSFDGADQGLLNMHFRDSYHRLSFAYNVTPSAHYQYIPAYRHFQSTINLVHFIGPDKPWTQGRDAHTGSGPFNEMAGRWWAVYDRHYRGKTSKAQASSQPPQDEPPQSAQPEPELVQYFVKGEYQPSISYVVPVGAPPHDEPVVSGASNFPSSLPPSHPESHHQGPQHPASDGQHQPHQHSFEKSQPVASGGQPAQSQAQPPPPLPPSHDQPHAEYKAQEPGPPPSTQSWDAQRQPPPMDSKPEAIDLPQTHYPMSSDTAPFVPPQRYPSPPRNMWYEVPEAQPQSQSRKLNPVFPWEFHQPEPSRVFAESPSPPPPPLLEPDTGVEPTSKEPGGQDASTDSQAPGEPSSTKSPPIEHERILEPGSASDTNVESTQSDPWSSFSRSNAWDDVPQIERYVDSLQQRRQRKNHGLRLGGLPPFRIGSQGQDGAKDKAIPFSKGFRITDFPSEAERPSLPVTPAPIRRRNPLGGHDLGLGEVYQPHTHDDNEEGDYQTLPSAPGVPAQTDWVCVHGVVWSPEDCLCDLANVLRYHKDPAARLQELAQQHADLLLQKLNTIASGNASLPLGSPPPGGIEETREPARYDLLDSSVPVESADEVQDSPAYTTRSAAFVSPQPIKPGSVADTVGNLLRSEQVDVPSLASSETIREPSYRGPGPAFEKGEDVPAYETPVPPPDEELDVLET